MTIRIESLSVENMRLFRNEHTLDLEQGEESRIKVVTGPNGSGKTTLVDSIRLCLLGDFSRERPLVPWQIVDQLSQGEEASGSVSLVISSSQLDRRFRFSRTFHTSVTQRGPANSVDSLQTEEKVGDEWASVNSSRAINTVFPLPAFTFCSFGARSSLDFTAPNNSPSWSKLVEDLGEAAAQQSAAHEADLPEYCLNNDDLEDELLHRIGEKLADINFRYRVRKVEGGLGGATSGGTGDGEFFGMPASEQTIASHVTAMVAANILPEAPPLIGDSIFGYLDSSARQELFNLIHETDRQTLLFATEIELEDFDITPQYQLELDEDASTSAIIATE